MVQGKISVLMGIYNCADTLNEAVDAILHQTYQNWQLIMCDDCSTDETYAVAQKLADTYPDKICLIRNVQNEKLQKTLNHCLEYADGEYIARMDGDDTCSPERFEKEIAVLINHPEYSLVSCQMTLFDKEGQFRVIVHGDTPTAKDLLTKSQFCHAGCMMRTTVLKKLGGYSENKNCERVEDYDLWVRMYAAGYTGCNIQEPLYAMRDDRNATKRRTIQNRLNESAVKFRAGRAFHMPLRGFVNGMIPLVKILIPASAYRALHRNKK